MENIEYLVHSNFLATVSDVMVGHNYDLKSLEALLYDSKSVC